MAKKLFHVSMIVDAVALYDITAIASKRSYNLKIEPVVDTGRKANGHDTDEPRVPAWSILQPFWIKQKKFDIKDALAFGMAHGINTRGAVYTACLTAQKKGWIKRTAPGVYDVLPALKKSIEAAAKSANK